MKNIFLVLCLVLTGTACQQAFGNAASTPDALAPYYGAPGPVKIVLDGKSYTSEIGTYNWIKEVHSDGKIITVNADAFAIITPVEPILLTSNTAITLKLPIPIDPTKLWYALFKVSEKDLASQDAASGAFRWNPNCKIQTCYEQTELSLLSEQDINLSLKPGYYVLEVHAGWRGMQADYGFLLRVQE